MESSPGQSAQRWKRSADTEVKNGRLFDSDVFFICLPLLCKLSAIAGRRNKLSLLLEPESFIIQDTILSICAKIESLAFELTWRKHQVEYQAKEMASTMWHVDVVIIIINPLTGMVIGAPQMILQPVSSSWCGTPLQIWSHVVTSRGCKALCGSYFTLALCLLLKCCLAVRLAITPTVSCNFQIVLEIFSAMITITQNLQFKKRKKGSRVTSIKLSVNRTVQSDIQGKMLQTHTSNILKMRPVE